MIHIKREQDCCGCNACVQKCPKRCISLIETQEGFLYPQVNKTDCLDCGLCEKVCPIINKKDEKIPELILAVKNPKEDERLNSSSGGVFISLAKATICHGGVVFGAVYDENMEVKHIYTECLENVFPMMRSKYMQSRIGNTFQEAERFLKAGREVLYVGTPCQIAGLHNYLQKKYDNLIAVDIVCHGVPSPGVWRDYLNELKSSISAQNAADGKNTVISSLKFTPVITGVNFREKHGYGWKKYGFVVKYKSALKAENTVLLSSIFYNNPFMRGFLANVYLRPSCYECPAKGGRSQSDMTIADYWGIDNIMPEFDDDKGVGLVLINTKKGKEIFGNLELITIKTSYEFAKKNNIAICQSVIPHPKRNSFFQYRLSPEYNFEKTINKILKVSFRHRFTLYVKKMIKKMI